MAHSWNHPLSKQTHKFVGNAHDSSQLNPQAFQYHWSLKGILSS